MKFKKILNVLCLTTTLIASSNITALDAMAVTNATDPNGDGVLDVFDSVYIAQFIGGKIYPTNLSPLDYDGNGIISQMDAYKIARAISS
ncbi:MAG: hypothetical protein ACI4I9_10380 [Porcipelethomonas sp.]